MTRPRSCHIKVWCTEEEKKNIENNAQLACMSLSMYLRSTGLLEQIRAPMDYHAIKPLVSLHGDLGRVAGLLKLWLVTNGGKGSSPSDITEMMTEFRVLQRSIFDKIADL
ncbi:plasmid mobilization protein [Bartonella sp. HY761]|uniref:plasmid mobilization protein n=1 Tax=Bartonella sp. HY761 TaxID=2979330 RepID=UPI0021FA5CA8|nr:conjugal transfer protein TraJ [Bartonella sp. HY761]UXN05420.1 conjugal transfer protein TraJ [Bartonella sp. HY761]